MSDVAIPQQMQRLARDSAGRPIPYFARHRDGGHDFRVVDARRVVEALRLNLCWVCGGHLGANKAFTVGPMCVVNRVSSEPPGHRDCALYSARACPFLANPSKVRRDTNLPPTMSPGGVMIERNPGVTAVYVTRRYEVSIVPDMDDPDVNAGVLIHMGEPNKVLWFHRGHMATRDDVQAAMRKGLPALREAAEHDGYRAVDMLEGMVSTAMRWLPT